MTVSGYGEVPEWFNGAVSKTVVPLSGTEGSNPSLSAPMLFSGGRKVCQEQK
jgi:hypothetical protein